MQIDDLVSELESRLSTGKEYDYITLIESSNTIERIASLILGILINVILILIPIIVAMEIMYISFPAMRDKTNELIIKLESKGVDKKVLGFVFKDAIEAVKRANIDVVGGRSALWIYFTIKIKSIFFIFFLVAFVVKGGGYIVDIVWNLVGNLIQESFY